MENEEFLDELPKEEQEDTTDWKLEATKRDGIARRFQTKAQKLASDLEEYKKSHPDVKPVENETPTKNVDNSSELTLKTYFKLNGVESEDFDWAKGVMKQTGKTIENLDDMLNSKYFQAELKERKESRQTKEAIPDGTKRSQNSSRDTEEYWLDKEERPEDPELRRRVVNARIKREEQKSKFTDRPIV